MARSPRYPFLVRQGDTLHARINLPADVRPAFAGKKILSRSTKTADPEQAYCRARPWIERWKAEIEAARAGAGASPTEADTLAREYAAETGFKDILLIRDVMAFAARRWSNLTRDQVQAAEVGDRLDPVATLKAIDAPRAVQAVQSITKRCTPFAAQVEAFKAEHAIRLAPKVVYEYALEIERFGTLADVSVETFSVQHVQRFIDARATQVSTFTIKKQVSALRTYWTWLCHGDNALASRKPFDGIVWPKAVRIRPDPTRDDFVAGDTDDGPRFTPEEVCALWEAADKDGHVDLRDAMVIAAYTGMRRFGIFSLHAKTIKLDAPTPYICLNEKTEAGRRIVPVHPALLPILARRAASPQPNGYLLRGGCNKVASPGARLTNPMRALLDAQCFGKGYGFHSFRRTFVDLLQQSSVAEAHAARIVGHGIKTITYGLYAGGLPPRQVLDILVATMAYPRPPAF